MIARPDDPDTQSAEKVRRLGLSVSARDAPLSSHAVTETGVCLLRRLADEAAVSARRFQEAMNGAARREARATAASVALQERLRLGARMLHAQQGQIERLERLVSELQSARASAELALQQLREVRVRDRGTQSDQCPGVTPNPEP